MPAKSEAQRRAAGTELRKRKQGTKRQPKGRETRPFGSATQKQLKDFARK